MTEDVPHMTEDVPHMAEDAPEMTEDVQAIVAEDLGRDGAEGLTNDAEEFSGGPHDLSVLTLFADHVAHVIWSGQRETDTFHLPVGELMITLDDVSSLLHLPISDAFHSFHALYVDKAIFLLIELLEVSAEEARAETTRSRGAYVRLGWVRDIYEMRCQAWRWVVAARAYLLHLSGGYAWGVVALVHMYDHFDEASRTTTRQIGGAGSMSTFRVCISVSQMMCTRRRPHVLPGG
ncbi:protein MAIN-LIKE 1-like [Glycine soja]|uniref:protein MAIN-LIKE 1-like n=1 Tax=Glycine soja TaxID=3848 RepID=UPI00103B1146|nr:protein MAIN-LIKE 1-like [Glycine soja]